MKNKTLMKKILVTGIALVTLPVALVYTDYAISNQPEVEKVPEAVLAPRVTVEPVTAGSYRARIQAFGEVRSVDELSLSSQLNARVIWRNPDFANGMQVKKGDVLLKLDATDFDAAVATAEREIADAKLALQQEKRQSKQAQQDWHRAGLKEAPSDLTLRKPQLAATKARYQAARADLKRARRDLQQTQVKAPFDAVILQRNVSVGAMVSSGVELAKLRSTEAAEVTVALSADQWRRLPKRPGDTEVVLQSQDQPSVTWSAKLQRVGAAISAETRLRDVVVRVDQPLQQPQPLLSGSFVSVTIVGQTVENLFAVPASSLGADGYLWYVQGSQLKRHYASPLFSGDDRLYIEQGELPESLQVVRKPLASYLPGMTVTAESNPESTVRLGTLPVTRIAL